MAANPSTPTIKTISGPGALVDAGGGLAGEVVRAVTGCAVVGTAVAAVVGFTVVATVTGRVVLNTLVWVGETGVVISGLTLWICTFPTSGVMVLPSTG
jgi:hypothetical protein